MDCIDEEIRVNVEVMDCIDEEIRVNVEVDRLHR